MLCIRSLTLQQFVWLAVALVGHSAWAVTPPEIIATFQPRLKQLRPAEQMASARQAELDRLADYIVQRRQAAEPVHILFVCTHNSRRSHLAQVWSHIAADVCGLSDVHTYSGGTEATACNIRTVDALRRLGLQVVASSQDANPRYVLQYADNRAPLELFSKVYTHPHNPTSSFAAVMCCDQADQHCPVIAGGDLRLALHYTDPKVADGTPTENETYDARAQEIGREMFYVFTQAARRLDGN